MTKPISKQITDVLKKYNIDPKDALWDCHGTWVMYHRYIEQVAQLAGIYTELKQVIDSSPSNVVILVEGVIGDTEGSRTDWTFGEANPKNNKNAYPYAMAEKRAKDRVILKLIGLAGHVYSTEDIADKNNNKNPFEVQNPEPQEYLRLNSDINKWEVTTNVVTNENGESNWDTWTDFSIEELKLVRDPKGWSEWRKQYENDLEECYKYKPQNLETLNKLIIDTKEFFSPQTKKESKNV